MFSFAVAFDQYRTVCYGMVAFLYTEGIQLAAAHSGGRLSDLTQEEVQHQWCYNLYCGKCIIDLPSQSIMLLKTMRG